MAGSSPAGEPADADQRGGLGPFRLGSSSGARRALVSVEAGPLTLVSGKNGHLGDEDDEGHHEGQRPDEGQATGIGPRHGTRARV